MFESTAWFFDILSVTAAKIMHNSHDSLAILILLEAPALTRVSSDMQTYYSRSFIHLDIRINLSTCIHYYYNVTQCLNVV